MLIEGSSGSSGGLVGEHQPDELMRDGGRWAGRTQLHIHTVAGHQTIQFRLGRMWKFELAGVEFSGSRRFWVVEQAPNGVGVWLWFMRCAVSQACRNVRAFSGACTRFRHPQRFEKPPTDT